MVLFNKEMKEQKAKYSLSDLADVFFDLNNWHYNKRKINVVSDGNNGFIIVSKDKGVNYLTLFEANTSFMNVTKGANKFKLNAYNLVEIAGRRSGNIRVIIYIIEYDEQFQRIHTNKFGLNDTKMFASNPKTKYARLAIRVLGIGELHIKKFMTTEYAANDSALEPFIESRKMKDIKMACIFDEFTMSSFRDLVSLITFSPNDWKSKLEAEKPDLLMVESAWKGNSGAWEYEIGTYNNNDDNAKLRELLLWCKSKKIPTIFWNKEDPIHFNKFIKAASLFDYILTTDEDMIPKYREHVGHDRIRSMQFAANPIIHNPISINRKKDRISFAGSYYANRHIDRKKDMDNMLRITKKYGLDIYDRNYERNKTGKTDFQFPEEYKENIIGTLKYSEIYKAYKDYRLIMNVNSVKYSPTMFSRRVFEGLACGTPVISSYSVGIKKTFHNIVSLLNENEEKFEHEVKQLMENNEYYRKKAMRGMREVFRYHTYEKRMEDILELVGIEFKRNKHDITVLFTINSKDEFNEALKIIESQSYENIKVLMALSLFEGYETLLNKYNNKKISTYIKSYLFKYDNISDIVDTEYFTILSTENRYGPYYIEDLVHAGIYSRADIIGKKSINKNNNFEYDEYEYQYTDEVISDTAVFRVNSIQSISFEELIYDRNKVIQKLFKQDGKRVFSCDKFNFHKGKGVN